MQNAAQHSLPNKDRKEARTRDQILPLADQLNLEVRSLEWLSHLNLEITGIDIRILGVLV